MANRDDMVITPTLEKPGRAAAPTRARARRTVIGAKRGRNLLRRAALARATKRRLLGARAGAATAARGAGAARLARGGAIVLAAVLAAIAIRLASGRSFKGMGHDIAKHVLGDADERAIARNLAIGRLLASDHVASIANRYGNTEEIQRAFEIQETLLYRRVRGTAAFLEDRRFDVNGALDVLVERFGELSGILEEVGK